MSTASNGRSDDDLTTALNTDDHIYSGTEDEVLASILCAKNDPLKFIESAMRIVRKNSDDVFMSPTFTNNVSLIIAAERDAADEEDAKKIAMIKEKIESLAESILVRKGGALDFVDFAMKVVRKKTDLFRSEMCIDSVMRIVGENRRVVEAEIERAKIVLSNILKEIVEMVSMDTYSYNLTDEYPRSMMREDIAKLEDIERRIGKMVYKNCGEFQRDIQIGTSERINTLCKRLLDERADEIEHAEAGINKVYSIPVNPN
ncbi:hypothetical protein ZOSMA_134G00150 [Zostera marina]|uniref:Uncharacterized protein n=1 Tax=Zostera marina TaxID=29655 RepID=A0A0K9PZ08_ZOSMR|nr:hypothetical protein ZOSMA_134G00150 [Zostera marina]